MYNRQRKKNTLMEDNIPASKYFIIVKITNFVGLLSWWITQNYMFSSLRRKFVSARIRIISITQTTNNSKLVISRRLFIDILVRSFPR